MWTLEVDLVAYLEGTYDPRLRSSGLRSKVFNGNYIGGGPIKGLSREASAMKLWTRVTWI